MAFTSIPNEAIDRMAELSAGAWRLYCLLLRYRNHKTGKCCPSAQTLAQAMKMDRRHIFRLKSELAQLGWATFDGGDVTELFGLAGDNIVTTPSDIKVTAKNVTSDKKVTREGPKCHQVVAKMSLAYKEEQDERTRRNEQEEIHVAVAPVYTGQVQVVFTYWQQRMSHPQAKLTPKREKNIRARLKESYTVEDIKLAIDGCASSPFHMGQNEQGTVYDDIELICRNGEKLESFISRRNGNGGHQIPRNETYGERTGRQMEELFADSVAASFGDSGPNSADTEAPWLALDSGGF